MTEPIDAPFYRYEIELNIQFGPPSDLEWMTVECYDFISYRLPLKGETFEVSLGEGDSFVFTVNQVSHQHPTITITAHCPAVVEMGLKAFKKLMEDSRREGGSLFGPLVYPSMPRLT